MSTIAHQFDDHAQQRDAATLGIWAFLATEILFFGGLFLTYAIYRHAYPTAWSQGSHLLNQNLASLNTALLLTSSLTMALAVHFAQQKKSRPTQLALLATLLLGTTFLCIKATEYKLEYSAHLIPALNFQVPSSAQDPAHLQLFMIFYFLMTLLHALHMLIGLTLLTYLTLRTSNPAYLPTHPNTLEIIALYWHFIDLVWIFLFPLLYLVR